ncbi:Aluminium activated malate transporter family protein [Klebsormidium nitens]|uniref:Aluminium activated malate transporter family protein n=1 Tax=Klebsormidium nitens TaxID=105231 RepID=A0A1Y1ITK2_KLENI|nr:Aluminium activated malate transporter family protein [Klebsormidium nitens]|eukprot:GAQ92146.1 Aluminium activated malate transporter family protein [Klebsormidium nitens]
MKDDSCRCHSLLLLFGYRLGKEGPRIAGFRLLLIALGSAIALATNLVIKPFFVGDELHEKVAKNFEKVASTQVVAVRDFVEGLRLAPLHGIEGTQDDDVMHLGYRDVILSLAAEKTLGEFSVSLTSLGLLSCPVANPLSPSRGTHPNVERAPQGPLTVSLLLS